MKPKGHPPSSRDPKAVIAGLILRSIAMPRKVSTYPGKMAIRRAVEIARDLNIDVAGFEITAEGTIKIIDRSMVPNPPKDEFEAWERAGKLG
jgi:hypothetical protein